ncbi:MAG: helix-turn-helix domain-containing protein [Acidobacteriaceae bacterium]|nr:helix-turn-helix domain-containing protein [Acidobacteriaceae bacterium]
MLLAARLRSGRTLEDVSAKTRITLKNLTAIERDELSCISSPFFYKSFVRQYAEQLNLNFSQIAQAVQAAADTMPQPLMPGQGDAPLPKTVLPPAPKRRRLRWLHSLASLMLVLVACSTLYAMWQNSRSHPGRSVSGRATSHGGGTAYIRQSSSSIGIRSERRHSSAAVQPVVREMQLSASGE